MFHLYPEQFSLFPNSVFIISQILCLWLSLSLDMFFPFHLLILSHNPSKSLLAFSSGDGFRPNASTYHADEAGRIVFLRWSSMARWNPENPILSKYGWYEQIAVDGEILAPGIILCWNQWSIGIQLSYLPESSSPKLQEFSINNNGTPYLGNIVETGHTYDEHRTSSSELCVKNQNDEREAYHSLMPIYTFVLWMHPTTINQLRHLPDPPAKKKKNSNLGPFLKLLKFHHLKPLVLSKGNPKGTVQMLAPSIPSNQQKTAWMSHWS